MMYRDAFVLSVLDEKGKTLRESNGREVFLPYQTEYSLRLRNRNDRPAVAEIFIDGTDVLGGQKIIVPEYSYVDVDRFMIDRDMNRGRRFKFVPADHPDVQDPTSEENGNLRVRFYLEKHTPRPTPRPAVIRKLYGYSGISGISGFFETPLHTPTNWQIPGARGMSFSASAGDVKYSNLHLDENCAMMDYMDQEPERGATVEGSMSGTQFRHGSIGALETCFTEICLSIRPSKMAVTTRMTRGQKMHCGDCGAKNSPQANFCTHCGARLERQFAGV